MSGFFNANKLVKRVDRLELLNSTLEIPSPSWGLIEGNLQDQEDLQTELDSKGGLRTFNQWSGTNIYTGQIQLHNQVYFNDRTGIMFDPESTSISKQAYAQIAYRASTDRHFKFKVHGITNSTFWGNLDFSGILSSDKTFTFPNKSGTIALLDDLTTSTPTLDEVVTAGNQVSSNRPLIVNEDSYFLARDLSRGSTRTQLDARGLEIYNYSGNRYEIYTSGDELRFSAPTLYNGNQHSDRLVLYRQVTQGSTPYEEIAIGVKGRAKGYPAINSDEFTTLGQVMDSIAVQSVNGEQGEVQLDLTFGGGSISITGGNTVNLDTRYYSIAQLNTSGSSNVHWDNITNKPTGFSGSFATATDTITVVDGLITAVTPL